MGSWRAAGMVFWLAMGVGCSDSTASPDAATVLDAAVDVPTADAAPVPDLGAPSDVSQVVDAGLPPLGYSRDDLWLCRPGLAHDRCLSADLTATELHADGTRATLNAPAPATSPAYDRFCIYPTVDVTGPAGNHTDLSNVDPMLDPLLYQVARFRSQCRVVAPLYRQATLLGLNGAGAAERETLAFNDVAADFRAYLQRDNNGRHFVLMGHSQGSFMTERLLTSVILPDAAIEDVAWEEIAAPEVEHILTVAVTTRVGPDRAASPGCERDALGPWLDRVARVAHPDPVERLGWMATLAPALARRSVTEDHRGELLGAAAGWLEEVDRRKPSAVRGALQAVERLATSEFDPAGTLVETVTANWGGCAWPDMPSGDARALLHSFVKGMAAALVRRDGSRARMFAHLLLTLAPAGYALAAERLVWFAKAVASPIGAAALDGSAVRDALTAGVGRWFDELPRGSTCGAAEVVLEWWASPLGACTHEEPVASWLAEALPEPDDRLAA